MKSAQASVWVRCLLLAASLSVALAQEALSDNVVPSTRVTNFVWVRSTPEVNDNKVGKLSVGESAELIGQVPRWYKVRLSDGTEGFVSKAWTTVTQGLSDHSNEELRIHFLNVGTGTCTLIECPGSNSPPMIVDCGSTGRADPDMTIEQTRDYIQGVLAQHSAPPNLVLSHGDRDHYSWVPTVLGSTQVQNIWLGGSLSDYGSDGFAQWLQGRLASGAQLHSGFQPDWHNSRQPLGNGLSCGPASTYVLTVNTGQSKNAQSLVLMVEYRDFTAVFTGDAEGVTERRAVENYANAIKTTVVTGSHHGANTHTSNSSFWITSINPTVAVFSAGDSFWHPRCLAVERFTTLASTLAHDARCGESNSFRNYRTSAAQYMTRTSGTVIISTSGQSPLRLHCTVSVECGVQIAHE